MTTIKTNRLRVYGVVAAGLAAVCALLAATMAPHAGGCPFCAAPQQTLSEELDAAQAAVFAQLVKPMPEFDETEPGFVTTDDGEATFRVVQVVRGDKVVTVDDELSVVYFGQDSPDKRFLITSLASDRLDWSTPMPVSESAIQYIRQLSSVPAEGPDRLDFFQQYLEHDDPLLSQDAYDEFARAPYEQIIALGDRIQREKLLKWIDDPNVGPSNRRLYLTLLGVCGRPEDVATLERLLSFDRELIDPGVLTAVATTGLTGASLGVGIVDELVRAEEQRKKQSLDALIACYLKLKGRDGLELVNRRFLGNPNIEYTHLHSAIMALRFHGEEDDVLPREDLLKSIRLALDHPDLADQVVPDLARWEDWDSLPRLVQMFKESEPKDWIRQPVVSYLLVAAEQPGDVGSEARQAIAELESLDPETVERAKSLSMFNLLGAGRGRAAAGRDDSPEDDSPAKDAPADDAPAQASTSADPSLPDGQPPASDPEQSASAPPAKEVAQEVSNQSANPEEARGVEEGKSLAASTASSASDEPKEATRSDAPLAKTVSRYTVLSAVALAALAMLGIFAVLIRGADPRTARGDDPSAAAGEE